MRQNKVLWLLAALLTFSGISVLTSCSSDDHNAPFEEPVAQEPSITSKTYVAESKMTVINFEYPSVDPFGKPATLSGTITIGDEVNANTPARGLLLYNHFTVYRADQCPSKGNLGIQKFICGSGLITVSADYYGFGCTEDRPQAYCISAVNAQASVDALLAAKKLLPTLGYSWNDDILFNAGYSQGGQTSMAVVRLIDEKYPDLHITYTFAGGGSYDIPETYRQFIQSGATDMPSSVISVLLSYNEYFNLRIPLSGIFAEPTLSHLNDWVLSKRYTSEEIDRLVGSGQISAFVTPAMLDLESDLSKRFFEVLDRDNLCKGWTPRKNQKILLVHHDKDKTVPVANTVNMAAFLQEQGVEGLKVMKGDYGQLANRTPHEVGAVIFAVTAVSEVCQILGITVWFKLEDLNIF